MLDRNRPNSLGNACCVLLSFRQSPRAHHHTAAVKIQAQIRKWKAKKVVQTLRDDKVREQARNFKGEKGTLSAKENCSIM